MAESNEPVEETGLPNDDDFTESTADEIGDENFDLGSLDPDHSDPDAEGAANAGNSARPNAPAAAGQSKGSAAPTGQPAETPPGERPYSFRADRQEHTLPGARVTDEGVFIPKSAEPQLRALLSQGKVHEGSFQKTLDQYRSRAEIAESMQDARIIKAEAYLEKIGKLMDEGPEAVAEWIDELPNNRALLESQSELAAARARADFAEKHGRAMPAPDDDEAPVEISDAKLAQLVDNQVPAVLQDIRADHADRFAALDDADWSDVHAAIKAQPDRYLFIATQAEARSLGLTPGEVYVNTAQLENELVRMQTIKQRLLGAGNAAARAAAANGRTNGRSAPPPAAPGRGAPAATNGAQKRNPHGSTFRETFGREAENKQEYDDWFKSTNAAAMYGTAK